MKSKQSVAEGFQQFGNTGAQKLNTWGGQEQNGSQSITMQAGISHGPNVGGGGEILGQARQVQSPFPGIPLVHNILGVEDILTELGENRCINLETTTAKMLS